MKLRSEELFFPKILRSVDAAHFVGRSKQLRKALNKLGDEESALAIFGERGIGKSSFAWQLASILEDRNTVFSRNKLQHTGADRKFSCVFPTAGHAPKTLRHVVANMLSDTRSEYSFHAKYFSEFELWDIEKEFASKYGVGPKKLASIEDPGEFVFAMLDELCQLLRNNNPRVDLVLFIDEADQIRDRTGFGQLVKRIDTAKIVIVGIGDTIDNLISDHASSGRKLIGGLIELETLEEKEIEKIFRDAEEKSNGMLSFTNSFIQKAKRLSAGFPWVAQNLGYQALTRELLNRDVDAAGPVKLGMEAFRYAVDEVRSVYVNDIDKKVRFEELNTPEAALLVSIIANAPRGRPLTDKEISQELLKQGHRMSMVDIDLYLGRLEDDANLLVKRTDLRYRFRDPIARTFALDRIDQVRGETVDDTE